MSAGVYIDDSGTPGVTAPSRLLHLNRKTWAAVVVPESAASDLSNVMRVFLRGVKDDYCVDELHFTEIYGGRGAFKDISIHDRFRLIELMVGIFRTLDLPVLVQTLSPEFASELRRRGFTSSGQVGFLNLGNHEHLSLLLLLFQVREFMLANVRHFPRPIDVFVDEGMAKAGSVLKLLPYRDVFRDGNIRYVRSHETDCIQLADFAAFVVARTQWLVSKGKLKERDQRFLQIVSPLTESLINIPAHQIDAASLTPDTYEALLVEDRRSKGLPDYPEDAE